VSTAGRRIAPGDPGRGGYRPLTWTRGEPHQTRRDSGAPPLPDGWRSRARPLLITAHLSDLHVTDHQSPARMELLDRYVDLDSPLRWELGVVGTYRPQELFTHHVVEAMVLAVNAELRGPVSGAPIDLAVVTGDATDNAQCNELESYLDLLNGAATVVPDSGDYSRYDGVAGPDVDDTRYWHPEGGPDDLARRRYGFPEVPGLLDTMREPFLSSGLAVPWLAVHGNHDLLMQGTVPSVAPWDGWPHQRPQGGEPGTGARHRPGVPRLRRLRPVRPRPAGRLDLPRYRSRPAEGGGDPGRARQDPPGAGRGSPTATATPRPTPRTARRTTGSTATRCGSWCSIRSTSTAAGMDHSTGSSWSGCVRS
jgi:hypothetical protein